MDERERLIEIMNSQGLTAKQLSLELGVSAGTLSNILGGRNKPSLELLKSIATHYPFIKSDWLFLGKGKMYEFDYVPPVAIAGVLDVPLVFLSARLWRSIHPSVFASKGGGLEPEMAVAVIASVLCFGLVWAALLILRSRQLVLGSRLDAMLFDRMMDEDEKQN